MTSETMALPDLAQWHGLQAVRLYYNKSEATFHASAADAAHGAVKALKAMEDALQAELQAIESDISWAEASQLEGLIERRARIEAALTARKGPDHGRG
jgi:hypothetical protein